MPRSGPQLLLVFSLVLAVACSDGPETGESPVPAETPPREAAETAASPAEEARLEARAGKAIAEAEKLLERVDQRIAAGEDGDAGRAPLLISRARIRQQRGRFEEAAELAEHASELLSEQLPFAPAEPRAPARKARKVAKKPAPTPVATPTAVREPVPAAEPEPTRTALAAHPPPSPTPRQPQPVPIPELGDDTRGELEKTLREYRAAFEACDAPRLQSLWRMSESQVTAYQDICHRGRPKVLARAIGAPETGGDVALLCMDYHVTVDSEGRRVSLKKRGQYTGEFVRRPDGWQVSAIHEGCSGKLAQPLDPPRRVASAPPSRSPAPEAFPSAANVVLERFATLESPRLVLAGQEFAVQVALTTRAITRDVTVLEGRGSQPGMVQIRAPAQTGAAGAGASESLPVDVVLSAAGFEFPGGGNLARVDVPRAGDSDTALFRMRAPQGTGAPVPLYATFWRDGVFLGRAMVEIHLQPASR